MPSVRELMNLALQHHQAGRLDQAESIYRQILQQFPNTPPALHFLGLAAHQRGNHAEALPLMQKAIALQPNDPSPYNNIASVLIALEKPAEAIAALQRAAQLAPNDPNILVALGINLTRQKRHAEAIEPLTRALQIANTAEAHDNLGIALKGALRFDEAETHFRQAIGKNPNMISARLHLAMLLEDVGRFEDSRCEFEEALRIAPNDPKAHHDFALLLLRLGEFGRGWKEYEHRWNWPQYTTKARQFPMPLWQPARNECADPRNEDAPNLSGKSILLHSEQGFGDTIMFARFVPILQLRGAKVFFETHAPLKPLLQSLKDVTVLARGETLPQTDFHCPIFSLPRALNLTIDTIPQKVPYLHPDPTRLHLWQDKLINFPTKKIGVMWTGNPNFPANDRRSIALTQLAPLANIPNVTLFSLQKNFGSEQVPSAPFRIIDLNRDLHDFADTAAFISQLDLIIGTDTAAAHLAGALGKKVLLMLSSNADWRWFINRNDTPWYPTMRLFRQSKLGLWDDVLAQVLLAALEILQST